MTRQDDAEAAGERLARDHASSDPFAAAVRGTRMPIVISDPRQHDNPIIFANDAFFMQTGYARHEVIGRNCRFLQGPDTDPAAVATLHRAVAEAHPHCRVDLLNYRKDGTAFWNALFVSPVRDDAGTVVYYFASQLDITARKAEEQTARQRSDALEVEVRRRTADLQRTVDALQAAVEARTVLLHEVDHRVKNNLQMIAALVQFQARRASNAAERSSLRSVAERVEALSTVHRRMYQGTDVALFDIADFARDLATDLVAGTGRDDIALHLDLDPVAIGKDKAAPLALLVNELVANAVHHAFRDRGGRLVVRVKPDGDHVEVGIDDDGVGFPGQDLGHGSLGRTIVDVLARQLHAEVDWSIGAPGTRVRVRLPVRSSAAGDIA